MDFQRHTSLPTPRDTLPDTRDTSCVLCPCLHCDTAHLCNRPWNKSSPGDPAKEPTVSQLSHGRRQSPIYSIRGKSRGGLSRNKEKKKFKRLLLNHCLFLLELRNPQFSHFLKSHYFNKPQILECPTPVHLLLHSAKNDFMQVKCNIHITY